MKIKQWNEMKVTKYILLAGLVVLAASCNKETIIPGAEEEKTTIITETISANVNEEGTKVTINASGTFSWTAGDNIAVHVSNGESHKYVLTSDAGASGASRTDATATFTVAYESGYSRDAFAVYPSTIVATDATFYGQSGTGLAVTLPSSYAIGDVTGDNVLCPMIADNTGSSWSFKQLCGMLRLTINQIPADATELYVDFLGHKVCGAFTVASPVTAGTSVIATTTGSADDVITITGLSSVTSATITLPLPTGTYSDIVVTSNSSTKSAAVRHIHRSAGSYTASRAHGKALTCAMVAFNGYSSKKFVFAPGNLQATFDGSAWNWAFATSQYGYIGNASGNNAVTNAAPFISKNATVDQFGWVGATSSFEGAAQYGITSAADGYGTSLSDALKAHWGTLAIGDYTAGECWQTPTKNDWTNLASNSTSGLSVIYDGTKIILGLVIIPTVGWVDPGVTTKVGVENQNFTTHSSTTSWGTRESEASTASNYYTLANWKAMEDAGAIFLPASGYRSGASVLAVNPAANANGQYWSSTPRESASSEAYDLYFYSNAGIPSHVIEVKNTSRKYGCSVRLVREL